VEKVLTDHCGLEFRTFVCGGDYPENTKEEP
jgi:hypothetical protein